MSIRVGINGLGRIGRNYLRYSLDAHDLEVVAVNDIADATTLARLLRHDSTFGPLRHAVDVSDGGIVVDGQKIAVSSERDPSALNWRDAGADVVIESTGKFRSRATAGKHLSAGAQTVIISAPGTDVDTTIVIGVN
jgi:glyceraldehyde 3-phosphate dehydrogenase